MSAPSRLPQIPAPPHDPRSLLLAGWVGTSARAGFRAWRTEHVDVDGRAGTLVLAPTPDSARLLTERTGSFGGHRLPYNVAVGPLGEVYLLDGEAGELKLLDPCCCRFERVPCFARRALPPADECLDRARHPAIGTASTPPLNVLADPRAIAICDGDLFVADRGHARVLRFALAGRLPRGALVLPAAQAAGLAQPWRPTGLAFDGKGVLHVCDPVHGRIDAFDPRGRWLRAVTGLPAVTHLAVDCDDVVYAVAAVEVAGVAPAAGDATVLALDGGVTELHWDELDIAAVPVGAKLGLAAVATDAAVPAAASADWRRLAAPPAVLNGRTLPLAGHTGRRLGVRVDLPAAAAPLGTLTVTARGAYVIRIVGGQPQRVLPDRADLALVFPRAPLVTDAAGRICVECAGCAAVFDMRGRRLRPEDLAVAPRYVRRGELVTRPLDSRIEGCTWHRVELRGAIPAGCALTVQALTAEIELTNDELGALLPDAQAWSAPVVAEAFTGRWDCLLRAPPGRYLCLRLALAGNGEHSPCIESMVVEFPRISLRRFLPAVFGADPLGADFTDRFTALFDTSLRSIERTLDRLAAWFDPLSTPSAEPGSRGDFLSWLAGWIGIVLTRDWPEARRRHYVKQAARLYCLRGTREGLWRQLLLLLGFDRAYAGCVAERPQTRCVPLPVNCGSPPARTAAEPPPLLLEHYQLRRWLHAGCSTLGDDSVLWGKRIVNRSELSGDMPPPNQTGNAQVGVTQLKAVPDPLRDPFHVFAQKFTVFVPARVRDCAPERRAFEQLLALEVPAHTQCDVRYVEPRFRVGVQAMLGLDSVIARTPRDVVLDRAELNEGTVLSAPPAARRAPKLEVGESRVGTSTVLS